MAVNVDSIRPELAALNAKLKPSGIQLVAYSRIVRGPEGVPTDSGELVDIRVRPIYAAAEHRT